VLFKQCRISGTLTSEYIAVKTIISVLKQQGMLQLIKHEQNKYLYENVLMTLHGL